VPGCAAYPNEALGFLRETEVANADRNPFGLDRRQASKRRISAPGCGGRLLAGGGRVSCNSYVYKQRSLIMKHSWKNPGSAQVAITLVASILAVPGIFAQQVRNQHIPDLPVQAQQAQSIEEKLQQVINDKGAYATSIVRRWEDTAKANGRWDNNF